MSQVAIPIEKDFYEKVEQPGYLKHILYGDSVTGDSLIEFMFNGTIMKLPIELIFQRLIDNHNQKVEKIEGKEYIFFPDDFDFKIQNYDIHKDEIVFLKPKYIMRHIYKGDIYNNYLTNDLKISTTLNHSFVEVDLKNRTYKRKTPEEVQVVPIVTVKELRVPQKFALMYGHEGKYDYLGSVRKSKNNTQILFAIRPYKLCKKNRTPDFAGFVYDFEVPETHIFIANNVLVHNTDSLFIEIPSKPESIIDKVKLVNKTSKDINDLIVRYNREYLLPRCGFSPERNETFFKEEMVIDRMVMLDIKKSYAYRQVSSEAEVNPDTNELIAGDVYETPVIKKKSGLGVKSDMIEMTKEILDFLIKTALGDISNPKERYETAILEMRKYSEKFKKHLADFEFSKIGAPARWQKKLNVIQAMKLYNATIEKSFQYLSVGHIVYVNFASLQPIRELDTDLPVDKLNAMAIPIKFDPEVLTSQMKKFGITFNADRQWSNIYNKTCKRIMSNLKPRG